MIVATIIAVVLVTVIIFGVAITLLHSVLKSSEQEIVSGNMDVELVEAAKESDKKSSKVANIMSTIMVGIIAMALAGVLIVATIYKFSGEQITINNTTSLVIVSDSMSKFKSNSYEIELENAGCENPADNQFGVGDLLSFKTVSADEDLIIFDVYGYKASNGKIITHRYLGRTADGYYTFRGDNTGGADSPVNRAQILLHYTGKKLPCIGYFVLFMQSGFGIYLFISCIAICIIGELYNFKYSVLCKDRVAYIMQNQVLDTKSGEPEIEVPQELQDTDQEIAEEP